MLEELLAQLGEHGLAQDVAAPPGEEREHALEDRGAQEHCHEDVDAARRQLLLGEQLDQLAHHPGSDEARDGRDGVEGEGRHELAPVRPAEGHRVLAHLGGRRDRERAHASFPRRMSARYEASESSSLSWWPRATTTPAET